MGDQFVSVVLVNNRQLWPLVPVRRTSTPPPVARVICRTAPTDGRNPIKLATIANINVVGTTLKLLPMPMAFWRDLIQLMLRQLKRKHPAVLLGYSWELS